MKIGIKSITKSQDQKIVFNLSVADDESYVLNGVVSHNCRCTLAPASSDLEAVDNSDTEREFSEWLNER